MNVVNILRRPSVRNVRGRETARTTGPGGVGRHLSQQTNVVFALFAFIRVDPRNPWLKIFCSPVFALVLVGLEHLTSPYSFSGFQFGSSIVAQESHSCARIP